MHTSFCRNEKNTLKSRKRLFLEYLNSGFSFLLDISQVENASLDETQHFKSYEGQAQPRYCSWKRRKRRNSRTIHVEPLLQSWDGGCRADGLCPEGSSSGRQWCTVMHSTSQGNRGHEATQPHGEQADVAGQVGCKNAGFRRDAGTHYGSSSSQRSARADLAVPGPGTPRQDCSPHFFIPTEPQSWQLRDRTRL